MPQPPVQLELYTGPLAVLPMPREAIEALTDLDVKTTTAGPSIFHIRFKLKRNSVLRTLFLLNGPGSVFPILRLVAAVRFKSAIDVLIDGVITKQSVEAGEGGDDTLVLEGEDLSKIMDLIAFDGFPFPGVPVVLRVAAMIGKYSPFGIVPLTIPPVFIDVPNPIERIATEKGTDLAYLRELAKNEA